MPGPRMGPRPPDFDEAAIRSSPTFQLWDKLNYGEILKYACRVFTKGIGDDEERLMRRIMIARRNNIKDHEKLKKARKVVRTATPNDGPEEPRRKRQQVPMADHEIEAEMDKSAVEATRSYQLWLQLQDGEEFSYNQKYIKGKNGHDWLLRKNIWRRMRYRRQNKKIVQKLKDTQSDKEYTDYSVLKQEPEDPAEVAAAAVQAAGTADHLSATDQAAIEAAVAAAESFGKTGGLDMSVVHNPLDATDVHHEALDAAAKLAAHRHEHDDDYIPDDLLDDHVSV